MPRKLALAFLVAALAAALHAAPANAEDNDLENPNDCASFLGGGDVPMGTVMPLPAGMPPPLGVPTGPVPGLPVTNLYQCVAGRWVWIGMAHEVAMQVTADATEVDVDEGSAAAMTGTYEYAGESAVTMSASFGIVTGAGDGIWSWSAGLDDGPGTYPVTVTATADGNGASTSFDLRITNVAPIVTSMMPSPAVALVGQPVLFAGTATDPSTADTAAGFTWSVTQGSFDTCGSHTVSGTATDKDGGVSDPFTSSVQVVDATFRAPLTAGARNVVKAGQVVPVKVTVGCGSTNLAGLTPSIRLLTGDVDPETRSDDPALLVPSSVSATDSAGVMRAVGDGYLYNLKVPKAAAGTQFTVRVSPVEGASAQVVLEVR